MEEFDELTKEDLLMTEEEAKRWGEQYADIIYHDGLEKGISKGISQEKDNNIIAMYKNNIDISVISKIVGKDKRYIKSIMS